MKYELPALPYAYDALEPHIDARTMEIHHSKHHAAYVAKLNEALEPYPELGGKSLEELLGKIDAIPEEARTPIRNHGGGHYNHSLFWRMMKAPKDGGGQAPPAGEFVRALEASFGSFADFKDRFSRAAVGHFGSGWAWLILDTERRILALTTLPNQDAPIMNHGHPILGLDLWEHAYYLAYQNRRAEYVAAWWNVVNWQEVESNFADASKKV